MSNKPFYPLSVPNIRGNEWEYVKECLDTEWVSTAGSFVERFEQDMAAFTGARFAIACSSGTAALQVAMQCAGVERGTEVIVPTMTFIATANAATYLGAYPVFVDCDRYYNISIESVRKFLDECAEMRDGQLFNRNTGRRVAAICPVHVYGNAVNFEELMPLCEHHNLPVIEDAAESLGTRYTAGHFAGSHTGTIGLLGAFSFNGNKIITTGGGGMIVTDGESLARRARHLTTTAKEDEVRYIHDEVGYNFRLTNVQAAIGVAQLEQLPEFLETKRSNYEAYRMQLADIDGLELTAPPDYADNNNWMYTVQIDKQRYGLDREELMTALATGNIQTRPVWELNHRQRPYRDYERMETPMAENLLDRTLCLPCSTSLTVEDIEQITSRIPRP